MNIGARNAVLYTVVAALLAGGLLAALPAPARAQDPARIESLFEQARDLWERGRTSEAAEALKQLLALDPSQDAVYDLLRRAEYRMFLDMLKEGGDSELIARRILDLGHVGQQEKMKDEGAIKALVADAIKGADYGVRVKAVRNLVARHGEYAVPYLYHYLGSNDRDERVNAILALTELSSEAVLPLTEALHSDDPMIRQNASLVLQKLGDLRALGGLTSLAVHATNPAVREAAGQAATALAQLDGGVSAPADAYLMLARKYYERDAAVIKNYLGTYTLWNWVDGKLVDRQVPKFLYHLELAEESCYDALSEAPDSQEARSLLAAVHYAQWAAVDALPEDLKAGDEGQALVEAYWNVLAITQAQGADTQLGALDLGLAWGDEGMARGALAAIPGVWDGRAIDGESVLVKALSGPKTVRLAAANTLLRIDPLKPFPGAEMVVPVAAQGVDAGSARQVLLVEPDSLVRAKALKALDDAGMFAVAESSAIAGFRRAKDVGTFDVIVIRAQLTDALALTMVKELRDDFRTAAVPILISGGEAELDAAKDLYGTTVQGFVIADPIDVAAVKDAASQSLNDDQKRALAVSKDACLALAAIQPVHTAYGNYAAAEAALMGVVTSDKPDDIRMAALGALKALGSEACLGTLAGAFAESANEAPVRVAAADALSGVLGGKAVPDVVFNALLDGVGDEIAEVRKAAGAALGAMKLAPEQANAVLVRFRVK